MAPLPLPAFKPNLKSPHMDELRKHAILFAATLLAARKLNDLGDKPSPTREACISTAIINAELILRKIDRRWPDNPAQDES